MIFGSALVAPLSPTPVQADFPFVTSEVTASFISSTTAENLGLPASSTPEMIAYYARIYDVSEDEMGGTLMCESHLKPDAVGDHGHSFGIAQIYLPAHPDITKSQALDPEWSIKWMASQFAIHRQHLWTCWRNLYQ